MMDTMGTKKLSFESKESYDFAVGLAIRRAMKFFNFVHDGVVLLATVPAMTIEDAKKVVVKEYLAKWFWWCPDKAPKMSFEEMVAERGLDPDKVEVILVSKP